MTDFPYKAGDVVKHCQYGDLYLIKGLSIDSDNGKINVLYSPLFEDCSIVYNKPVEEFMDNSLCSLDSNMTGQDKQFVKVDMRGGRLVHALKTVRKTCEEMKSSKDEMLGDWKNLNNRIKNGSL